MKKWLYSFLNAAIVLFGTSILGLSIGAFFPFVQVRFLTPWYSLGIPPEPAKKIISVHALSITVASSSGNLYSFEPANYGTDQLQGNWIKNSALQENNGTDPICEFDTQYASLPQSAKTIDYAAFAWCPEIVVNIQYAILEDGSVWRWNPSYHNTSTLPPSWLIGIGIGLVIGIILIIGKTKMRYMKPN